MKWIVMGGCFLIGGLIGLSILCAGAMASDIFINGSREIWAIFNYYNVTWIAITDLVILLVGVVMGVIEFIKNSR